MIRLALLLALAATPARAVTHVFCWQGANGYRMEGYITYPDTAQGWLITETTVTGFGITGWRGDTRLGEWSLKDRGPDTTFVLRFDSRRLAFRMGGLPQDGTYQAWNADGTVTDCGDPGFGFNGGNVGQDICVDGTFIRDSTIPPDTPLSVSPDPSNPCGPLPMSRRAPQK